MDFWGSMLIPILRSRNDSDQYIQYIYPPKNINYSQVDQNILQRKCNRGSILNSVSITINKKENTHRSKYIELEFNNLFYV